MLRLAIALAFLAPATARAADALAPTAPAELGVRVEKPAGDGVHYSQGSGVYLGDGLVLTAEHVIKYDPTHPATTVLLDGVRTPGAVVFDGVKDDGVDLALVKIGAELLPVKRLEQEPVRVCADNPAPDKKVIVAALGMVSDTTTYSSPMMREGDKTVSTADQGGWTNILATGYHQGNSGGGVFDPVHGCLWGILSFEMGGEVAGGAVVDYTAFVPASRIAPFLADYVRAIAAHPDNGATQTGSSR
jgi:hypothetical protein